MPVHAGGKKQADLEANERWRMATNDKSGEIQRTFEAIESEGMLSEDQPAPAQLGHEHDAAQAETGEPLPDGDHHVDQPGDIPAPPDAHPEARRPRKAKAPEAPSQEEIDEHVLTHLPFKSWCQICVACRRNNRPHYKSKDDDRELPLLNVDYCFLQDSEDKDPLVVALSRVRPSRLCMAMPVPRKGGERHSIRQLAGFIREAGLTKCAWESDQEYSLRDLCEKAIRKSGRVAQEEKPDSEPIVAVPETSSVGESPSNGFVERGIQLLEDQARTLKFALQARLEQRVDTQLPVIHWLLLHAGNLLNKYHVHRSLGKTSYEVLHGKRCQ